MDAAQVQANVAKVAAEFAADRRNRQLRRHLDPADFRALAAAGYLLTGVPAAMGGLWTDLAGTTRGVCEILRSLAQGDPSVALVSAMHPAVLASWCGHPAAPEPYTEAWREQGRFAAQTALDGCWWGTITSEPGSGGDVSKTRSVARRGEDGVYSLSGQKHFGSGSGITSYMITTALPEGEEQADLFFLDVREATWDGSRGMKLTVEWDGHGMTATQSHAFEFSGYPATRLVMPGGPKTLAGSPFTGAVFTAVVVGVVQSAVAAAREQVGRRRDGLHAYESAEWARVENEAWLIDQAYEGMLRAVEAKGAGAGLDALHAKTAIAELAESVTQRVCRVIGGGSFHRSSHFGAAFEDVRALGYLRPPWALAYDSIFQHTWEREG